MPKFEELNEEDIRALRDMVKQLRQLNGDNGEEMMRRERRSRFNRRGLEAESVLPHPRVNFWQELGFPSPMMRPR